MYIKDLFGVYIDDHNRVVTTFDTMYMFLYNSYFLRVVFSLVYLLGKMIKIFIDMLQLLGFKSYWDRLRFLAKYWNKIKQMPVFTSKKELDAFL